MLKSFFFILITTLVSAQLSSQTSHKLLRNADKLYLRDNFEGAEETYRKAVEEELSANGEYNLGNSIYQQNRYEEALNHYEQAASLSNDPKVKSDAYYNLGNTYMNMQEFEKGVEAYKNALRNNPNDEDSKYNLSVANRLVKQHQQQQQQQQQQQESGEKEEKEQQQEEEQQQQQQQENEQQKGDEESEEEKKEESGEKEEEEQENKPESGEEFEKKDLSKEEAADLLKIVEDQEKRTQQKLKKADTKPNKQEKDW